MCMFLDLKHAWPSIDGHKVTSPKKCEWENLNFKKMENYATVCNKMVGQSYGSNMGLSMTKKQKAIEEMALTNKMSRTIDLLDLLSPTKSGKKNPRFDIYMRQIEAYKSALALEYGHIA